MPRSRQKEGIALLIFNLGTSGQPYAPTALPPGKELQCPWIGGLLGPRAILDSYEEEKILASAASQTPNIPVHSLVTTMAELSRLLPEFNASF